MKKIETTLFNNYQYKFEDYKQAYQEDYDLTDEEMEEIDDDMIWNYIYGQMDADWDDLFMNLKYSKFGNTPCVIIGSLGLWNGRPTIEPKYCEDIESAIRLCVKDVDYVIIKQINGHIEVSGLHHDGTNTFEIHLLNDKGIDAMNRIKCGFGNANLGNKCYHKAMNDYLF